MQGKKKNKRTKIVRHRRYMLQKKTLENPVESGEIEFASEGKVKIKNLKNGNAADLDALTTKILKRDSEYSYVRLSELMNICAESGKVPNDWTMAIIVPLYNGKGHKCICNNYRSISFLSSIDKIYQIRCLATQSFL